MSTSAQHEYYDTNPFEKYATSETIYHNRKMVNAMIKRFSDALTTEQRRAFQACGGAGAIYQCIEMLDTDTPAEGCSVGGGEVSLVQHLRYWEIAQGLGEHQPREPARTLLGRTLERCFPALARRRAIQERWAHSYRLSAHHHRLKSEAMAAMLRIALGFATDRETRFVSADVFFRQLDDQI